MQGLKTYTYIYNKLLSCQVYHPKPKTNRMNTQEGKIRNKFNDNFLKVSPISVLNTRTCTLIYNDCALCRDIDTILYLNVREEIACEEAELGPEKFAEKLQMQKKLHEAVQIQTEFQVLVSKLMI